MIRREACLGAEAEAVHIQGAQVLLVLGAGVEGLIAPFFMDVKK